MSKLNGGRVCRIRVNPSDCLSILDLIEKVGLNTNNMSYDQCVSLALASLLQTARNSNMLPDPDTFQFLNRMQPFMGRGNHKKKLEVTKTVNSLGEAFAAPSVTRSQGNKYPWPEQLPPENTERKSFAENYMQHPVVETPPTAEQLRDRRRLTELLQKKDMDGQGVVWGSDDEQEFQEIYQRVYPNG